MLLLVFASITFSFLISAGKVFATVGGPTYISSIALKVQDNSVYYTVHANDGRGCPPIVHKINLAALKDSEVKSCTQVEQEFLSGEYEEGMQKYRQFIGDIYQNLSYLGSVSLKNNSIDISVKLLSERIERNQKFWSEFLTTLTQDNKEIANINFRGCAKEQPHIFEGYMIPNSDSMAILISNKGDCLEGGYLRETLHIVKGIKYHDINIVRSFKEESATEPNLANTVVYAALGDLKNTDDISVAQKKTATNTAVLLAAAFVAGTALGYLIGRKFP